MSATKIEWTDLTWNPVTGCDKASPGCDHCYAETIAHRFAGIKAFPNGFDVTLHPERLGQPLRWRKPRRVFVNSMSDLFHADVPDAYIARVFAIMALAHRHTFQILTKRHGRMRALLSDPTFGHLVAEQGRREYVRCQEDWLQVGAMLAGDPLPNVWLGVSVEAQRWADIRVPVLLETSAAVRFLSCEPLLGPVRIEPWLGSVDWVIVGAESGPGARAMDHDWVRQLRDQCTHADVPFFYKQDATRGRKHTLPPLDGRTWDELPDPNPSVRTGDAPDVWSAEVAPGGYVCSVCSTPVESEPCPRHQPEAAAAASGQGP